MELPELQLIGTKAMENLSESASGFETMRTQTFAETNLF